MKIKYKINRKYILLFVLFCLVFSGELSAQNNIKKEFKPRLSDKAPDKHKNKSIYNLQGDFTMIGNSNAFVRPYSHNTDNSDDMRFVNVAPARGIRNSSTADFVLPANIEEACTEIVYAGLYWTGRSRESGGDVLSNGLNKKKIRFKAPGMTEYIELESNEIYYGSDANNMYSGYYDVTEDVRKYGTGTYAVANIATLEGRSDQVGSYAGWGMVIVYENTKMKWRDITIFDGFAFIQANVVGRTVSQELEVSGFRSAQNGNIRIKMGMMTGEGDRRIKGDFFQIKKRNTNTWQTLKHNGNTEDNFFNSSIFTGGNPRNPSQLNNFGTDIAVFDLVNTNNSIIGNNQTYTAFKYGTNQDTYSIFNITFAVDAYVPQIEVYNEILGGLKHDDPINPGDEFELDLSIYNTGSESINNSEIRIPLPPNLHYVESTNILGGGTVSWEHPTGTDPAVTPGGTLVWELGNIILPADKKDLLAKLKYKLRVSNDCTILLTSENDCALSIKLNGKIKGVGMLSNIDLDASFIRGYMQIPCEDHTVNDDLKLNINIDQSFIASCEENVKDGKLLIKKFCSTPNNTISRDEITKHYPIGTKFYKSIPGSLNYENSLVTEDFFIDPNGLMMKYYAIIEGMPESCFYNLATFLNVIDTKPIVNNITVCYGDQLNNEIELSETGNNIGLSLYYSDEENGDYSTTLTEPTQVGTYTYYVAEGKEEEGVLCLGPKEPFFITVNDLPIFEENLDDFNVCLERDNVISVNSSGAVSQVWEFFNANTDKWEELTLSSFNNVLYGEGPNLVFRKSPKLLNGLKVRIRLTNSQGCQSISKEATIKVKRCNIPTNPAIRVKTNKTI